MSTPAKGHSHADAWKWLDTIVWVTVGLIAVLGIEWLFGKMARESIAAGASKYLKRQAPAAAPAADK